MIRFAAWVQLLFILGCIVFSTYALYQGEFETAFIPYPILILYYLLFVRRNIKKKSGSEGHMEDEEDKANDRETTE